MVSVRLGVSLQAWTLLLVSCGAVHHQSDDAVSIEGINEIVTDPATKAAAAKLGARTRVVDHMVRQRDHKYLAALDRDRKFTGRPEIERQRVNNQIREATRKETAAWGDVKTKLGTEIVNDQVQAKLEHDSAEHHRDLASTATVAMHPQVPTLTKKAQAEDLAAAKLSADAKKKKAELLKAELLRQEQRIK